MQLPEIKWIEIINEIKNFEEIIFNRLLSSFETIGEEAKKCEDELRIYQNIHFNPDIHDEAILEEEAYFENINYQITQAFLRQEFLNSSAVWLFHIFEKRMNIVFSEPKKGEKRVNSIKNSPYFDLKNFNNIEDDNDWKTLYSELRILANAIKHGEGYSFEQLKEEYSDLLKYSDLLNSYKIIVKESDIKRYIYSMNKFWKKAIFNNIVFTQK